MHKLALTLSLAGIGILFPIGALVADEKAIIVHEWGTFTCLQDEQGNALGGINVDDEPVPGFVWSAYATRALAGKAHVYDGGFGLPPYANFSKGWLPADHDVTMRLETPVIYFYPPKGAAPGSVPPLDVHVDFRGGLLSQYYPYAVGSGFPLSFPRTREIHIGDYTTSLDWKGVRLGSTTTPVQTDDQVWTTPRGVSASPLEVTAPIYDGKGGFNQQPQAEHFLFYRGIGHLDSPIFLVPGDKRKSGDMGMGTQLFNVVSKLDSAWIVDIWPDGRCASRSLGETRTGHERDLGAASFPNFSAAFSDGDFSSANLTKLKASMHDALVKEGLFDDEATAMLKTWELSYFKSPGLRFFYIVPRAWVDQVLPLYMHGAPTEITRVMVGRIELISDAQKAILSRISAGPCPDLKALKEAAQNALDQRKLTEPERENYYGGAKPLSDLGIPIPPFVQDYLSLGRFRDALIVHEQQEHPSPALAQFIKDGDLSVGPQ